MRNFAYAIITIVCLTIINSCKTCECPAYSSAGNVKATWGRPMWEGAKAKYNHSVAMANSMKKRTYPHTRPEIAV